MKATTVPADQQPPRPVGARGIVSPTDSNETQTQTPTAVAAVSTGEQCTAQRKEEQPSTGTAE